MVNLAINYGTLDKVLRHFGFETKKIDEDHVAYFQREHDIFFVYPLTRLDEMVWTPHLLTARKMLMERGVADETTLQNVVLSAINETEAENAKNEGRQEGLSKVFPSMSEDTLRLRERVKQETELNLVGS